MCFEALKFLPYLLTRDGKVVEISYSWVDITGYPREDVMQKPVSEVFRNLFKSNFNAYSLENSQTESNFFLFTKHNQVRQVNITVHQGLSKSEKIYIFLEKPDSRLEDKYPLMQQLYLDNLMGIAVYSAPDLILLKANQQYLDFWDEPYNKIENTIGLCIEEFNAGWDENPLKEIWMNVINTAKTFHMKEYMCRKANGEEGYWDFTLIPIIENYQVKYIVVMLNDVTDEVLCKKRIEEQSKTISQQKEQLDAIVENMSDGVFTIADIAHEVEQKEAVEKVLKMKDEFLSFISHEFRTPLSVIIAAIQAMESICKDELSEKAKGFLAKVHQNCFRLLRLVNNLLDVTRADAGYIKIQKKNMDIVFLTKAITESVSVYAKEKGIELNFSSPLLQSVIAIDDEKYERILLNLLSNAIKFTPSGKSVSVKVFSNEKRVCIEVKDEGIGIPKDKQDVIFDRFGQIDSNLTRKPEGTGIGLYLAKLLVNALGGEITVDSKEGAGSTFTIILPAVKDSENTDVEKLQDLTDNRLIQSVAIEFSNLY